MAGACGPPVSRYDGGACLLLLLAKAPAQNREETWGQGAVESKSHGVQNHETGGL